MNDKHNKYLSSNARGLRKNMTPEERQLWYHFLKKLPVTVNRQKIICSYIVDFYCASAKLIIELDGSQHYEDIGAGKDAARDEYLKKSGYTVKRYFNRDIHHNFEAVCQDIHIAIFGKELPAK